MIKVTCKKADCRKEYFAKNSHANRTKYCSRLCQTSVIGVKGGNAGKGVSRGLGRKNPFFSEYNRTHIKKGSQVWNWKGDDASYSALHNWVHRQLGQPKKCSNTRCNSIRNLQWANKSKQYKRDLTDWITLCAKCHLKYDREQMKHIPSRFYNHQPRTCA